MISISQGPLLMVLRQIERSCIESATGPRMETPPGGSGSSSMQSRITLTGLKNRILIRENAAVGMTSRRAQISSLLLRPFSFTIPGAESQKFLNLPFGKIVDISIPQCL
jgi:hypothetical protein